MLSEIWATNGDFILLAAASVGALIGVSIWLWTRRAAGWPLALCGAAIVVTLAAGYFYTNRAADDERAHLRGMIEGIAPTYALQLEHLGHASVGLDTPTDDPKYLELIAWQKRVLAVNKQVADVYTLRRRADGQFAFVVDSETDYDHSGRIDVDREQRTPIGEVFEDADGSLAAAWRGEPFFSDRPVTDRWGTWVSATVPMRDRDGRVEALCGVDYPADLWNAHITIARRAALAAVATVVAVIGAAGIVTSLLRAHLAELQQQIGERNAAAEALAKAKEQADAANRAKSAFLANMSHEIRTPMTAIMGFADLLQDETATPAARAEYVATVRRNGRHLLAVVNDILDLSKIEAGKMTIESVPASPAAIVEEVASLMRVRATERGLSLETARADELPAFVLTDPTRLRQILMNLASNAIKFTARGTITLRCGYDVGRGELRFDVADTGVGIPPEVLARLFDPFQQAESSTARQFGGTGLGLVISRRLAGLLGGDLTVTSEPGRGSTFSACVAAPVHAWEVKRLAESAAAAAPRAGEQRLAGQRILLVEDGQDNQRLISLYLTREGATMRLVEHGKAAVEAVLASGACFDLVLMDMQMPVLDGYAATRQLRAAGHRGPIVALTAHASASDRQKCLDAGCDDYATRPIDREALIATCRSAIASARRAA